jgi:hypothetical protein
MKVVSEKLRPARGGLIFITAVAAMALVVIILSFAMPPPVQEPKTEVVPEAVVERPESPGPQPIVTGEATQEGMVRVNRQWVSKDEAFDILLREKGYARHLDWYLPEEDATRLAMGLLRHDETWLTPEELSRRLRAAEAPVAVAGAEPVKEPKRVEPLPEKPQESPEKIVKQDPEKAAPEPGPTTEPREAAPLTNEIATFLASVQPDEMETHEGLTLFSLTRQEREWEGKGSYYMTLADAVERGVAEIHETGTVDKLLVKKKPGITVFSVGGGIVIGGWQCRLIGPDVVLSTDATEAYISVYCAEQGRWKGDETFEVADFVAVSEVRKKSYNSEEQSRIWSTISKLRRSQGVHSSDKAYHKLYEKRSVKKRITAFVEAFARFKDKVVNRPHTVGIAALVDGRIVGADLFINNELLAEYYDSLIRTYALEAAMLKAGREELPAKARLVEIMREFVASAARSSYSSAGDASYLEYRIKGVQADLYGYGLSTDRIPVHVSLFSNGTEMKQTTLVTRPPKAVKKALDAPGDEPPSSTSKAIPLDEAAAAKLRKEGRLKPRVPLPPSPPGLPTPKKVVPKNPVVVPGFPGR